MTENIGGDSPEEKDKMAGFTEGGGNRLCIKNDATGERIFLHGSLTIGYQPTDDPASIEIYWMDAHALIRAIKKLQADAVRTFHIPSQ